MRCACGSPYCRRGCFGGFGATNAYEVVGAGVDAATLALLNSPQMQPVLNAVKNKAKEGVIEETKANALTLLAMAASAGAVGGMVFKGPRGAAVAGVITYLCVTRLMGSSK